MFRSTLPACALLAAVFSLYPAASGHAGRTAAEAQAFAERAVAHIRDVGREQAFADFTRPGGDYHDGELYVFCYASDGTNLAHGGNPAFVGKNLVHVKDPDGKLANAELIRTGLEQGAGWVDFRWPNPVSKKVEAKSAYVIRVDANTVCGSGYYKG
jgi:hypothetical protein